MRIAHRFRTVGMVGAVLLGTLAGIAVAADKDGFVPLFDGKTLDGWTRLGGVAKYTVEDGEIVGSAVPGTPNSFLCTKKHYGDFVLEYEFKVSPKLNSGVQVRSNSFKAYKNGRVHGYQVEIDPSSRAWTAGIYEEGRRGWLNPLKGNPKAQKAFKQNQWNKVRVEAIGDSLKTWLNGVPAADLVDSMTLSGFIGLQVHGVGRNKDRAGEQVRWRNLRIKDMGIPTWKPLFDGKTLAGFSTLPGGKWEVVDGVLVGSSQRSEGRHGLLVSDAKYKDFTIRLQYKAVAGNSGFYFRCEKVKGAVGVHGFQAEIDAANDVGGLYETGGRAWVVKPDAKFVKKFFKPGQWNWMTVSARGRRIVVHVNNVKTAELKNDKGRTEGHVALQLHGGQDMRVEVKDLEILTAAKTK
ncbi:MAG: DUF1080 domain-containing protein [Phycisphaerae bacterium]|nr:DUF1080 domain-containing protein [Phycisphaerae bacterium]